MANETTPLLSLVRIELENNTSSASINFPMLWLFCFVSIHQPFSLHLSLFFPLCSPLLCGCVNCCPDPAARQPFVFVSSLSLFPAAFSYSYSLWHIFSLDVRHKPWTPPSYFPEMFIFAVFLVESKPNVFEGVWRNCCTSLFLFLLEFLPFVQLWDLDAFEFQFKWNSPCQIFSNNCVCL